MFSVVTWGVRFFISPGSFAHFIIERSQLIMTTDAVLFIKVWIAIIKPNLFTFGVKFIIGGVF